MQRNGRLGKERSKRYSNKVKDYKVLSGKGGGAEVPTMFRFTEWILGGWVSLSTGRWDMQTEIPFRQLFVQV